MEGPSKEDNQVEYNEKEFPKNFSDNYYNYGEYPYTEEFPQMFDQPQYRDQEFDKLNMQQDSYIDQSQLDYLDHILSQLPNDSGKLEVHHYIQIKTPEGLFPVKSSPASMEYSPYSEYMPTQSYPYMDWQEYNNSENYYNYPYGNEQYDYGKMYPYFNSEYGKGRQPKDLKRKSDLKKSDEKHEDKKENMNKKEEKPINAEIPPKKDNFLNLLKKNINAISKKDSKTA